MMVLKVIGSSSKGNAYLLENDSEAILLECGVRFSEIKKAINFDVGKVSGCLVTHEHNDHAGAAKDIIGAGIDLYASKGTLEAVGIGDHHRSFPMIEKRKYMIGSFTVLPFGVVHDCAEPFGYLIDHPDCGKTLFTTDTYYLPFLFKGLNNIIAEVNYAQDIMDDNILNGRIPQVVRNRVLKSHMELGTFKEFLSKSDLSKVNNIVLVHLSDGNSDAGRFKQEIEGQTGKTVHIADTGMEIDFNTTPF